MKGYNRFYKKLEIILDETNMIIYNFYSSDNILGHIKYDVGPGRKWGSGFDDTNSLR